MIKANSIYIYYLLEKYETKLMYKFINMAILKYYLI